MIYFENAKQHPFVMNNTMRYVTTRVFLEKRNGRVYHLFSVQITVHTCMCARARNREIVADLVFVRCCRTIEKLINLHCSVHNVYTGGGVVKTKHVFVQLPN